MIRAAERGDVEAVKALMPLQKGKTASCVTIDKCVILRGTALMRAAACGHAEVVKLLVEHEGGMKDEDGWTALIYVARKNKADCIRLLLDKEGGMQDNDGCTALMHAAYNNNLECARLLAKRENRIRNEYGGTALDIAKKKGYKEIVSILSG